MCPSRIFFGSASRPPGATLRSSCACGVFFRSPPQKNSAAHWSPMRLAHNSLTAEILPGHGAVFSLAVCDAGRLFFLDRSFSLVGHENGLGRMRRRCHFLLAAFRTGVTEIALGRRSASLCQRSSTVTRAATTPRPKWRQQKRTRVSKKAIFLAWTENIHKLGRGRKSDGGYEPPTPRGFVWRRFRGRQSRRGSRGSRDRRDP